jgi:hypothetical protein
VVSPLAAAMRQAWDELAEHLTPGELNRLERDIAVREPAEAVAARRCHTGVFELLCAPAADPA